MTGFQSVARVRRSRKRRICSCCRSSIPKGTQYLKIFGGFDGSAYDKAVHNDCIKMLEDLTSDYASEGYDLDILVEVSGWDEAIQPILDDYRGHYPHVVCRLELRLAMRSKPQPGAPYECFRVGTCCYPLRC